MLLVKLKLLSLAADFLCVLDQLVYISDNWMQLTLDNIVKASENPSPCGQQSPKEPRRVRLVEARTAREQQQTQKLQKRKSARSHLFL